VAEAPLEKLRVRDEMALPRQGDADSIWHTATSMKFSKCCDVGSVLRERQMKVLRSPGVFTSINPKNKLPITAAALALVGWYLMVLPPLAKKAIDPTAPLSK